MMMIIQGLGNRFPLNVGPLLVVLARWMSGWTDDLCKRGRKTKDIVHIWTSLDLIHHHTISNPSDCFRRSSHWRVRRQSASAGRKTLTRKRGALHVARRAKSRQMDIDGQHMDGNWLVVSNHPSVNVFIHIDWNNYRIHRNSEQDTT